MRWEQAYRRDNRNGLRARPIPGRPCRLSTTQQEQLKAVLLRGTSAAGYSTELWTLKRIGAVIRRQYTDQRYRITQFKIDGVRRGESLLMARSNDITFARMAVILVPVVVGSLLGLITSLTTNFFTSQETLRKEHAAHLERAMTLTAKYTNDVGKLLGIGLITKGNVTPKDLALLTAPTDTLMELSVVISLYVPQLNSDVDQILVEHNKMMQRLDDIIDAHDQHRGEDAAAFALRIQKESAPTMDRVRSLMKKLSNLATQKRT